MTPKSNSNKKSQKVLTTFSHPREPPPTKKNEDRRFFKNCKKNETTKKGGLKMSSNTNEKNETEVATTETSNNSIDLGVDMTPVNVVVSGTLGTGIKDPTAIDAWLKRTEDLKGMKPDEKTRLLEDGVKMSTGMIADFNMFFNIAGKTIAEKAIMIGKLCNKLKELRRGVTDQDPWGVWADQHIPLNKRTRQKYMLIASREDCHDFTHLGVDKMEMLCSITKRDKNENAIKSMMMKYKIPFDKDNKIAMDEFNQMVIAMIHCERFAKNGLTIGFDKLKDAVKAKVKIDTALRKRMKDAQTSGGDLTVLLDKIIDGNGPGPKEKSVEQHLKDLNSLSAKMIKTLDYMMEQANLPDSDDPIDQVNKDTFEELFKYLEKLKTKIFGNNSN